MDKVTSGKSAYIVTSSPRLCDDDMAVIVTVADGKLKERIRGKVADGRCGDPPTATQLWLERARPAGTLFRTRMQSRQVHLRCRGTGREVGHFAEGTKRATVREVRRGLDGRSSSDE